MGEAIPFKPKHERIEQHFQRKIENLLRGSSFKDKDAWVFLWRTKGVAPALQIAVENDTNLPTPVDESLTEQISDFLSGYLEEDCNFNYLVYTYVGNEILFERKE